MSETPQPESLAQLNGQIKDLFAASLQAYTLPELDISLYLLAEAAAESQFSPQQVEAIWANMPYWAFAWSSGRALARYILDNPQLVAGKRICDFGAGSAIVAIAALKAGASSAWACDIDPMAHQASQQNARLNGVKLQCCDSIEQAGKVDLIVVGDVLYDTRNHGLAKTLFGKACPVLWAESRAQTKLSAYPPVAKYQAQTQPNIGGFDEHQFIHIYQR
ncbi:MAG: 50S ribosomal protein L11 methyltransferase [Bermanella sp.]